MNELVTEWIIGCVLAAQYVLGFVCFASLLRMFVHRRPRWAHLSYDDGRPRGAPPALLLRLLLLSSSSLAYRERESLLNGCGYKADPAWYMLGRRLVGLVGGIALVSGVVSPEQQWLTVVSGWVGLSVPPYSLAAGGALAVGVTMWDKPILEAVRKHRSDRIMKEIYVVSNQLLYFAGASLHLHVKLTRCLPYTRTLRNDLQRLLGEWYHDAESAIARFKHRVGTAEGMSFAETIEALRLHEDEAYYDLLRERLADYKAKLELAKDSRKESASYVLFLLAGMPILYMFQIFIHPWVQEAQRLFQSLNT